MHVAVTRPALNDSRQTNVAMTVSSDASIRKTRPFLGSKASRHAILVTHAAAEVKAFAVLILTVLLTTRAMRLMRCPCYLTLTTVAALTFPR
jgi:hypothetical protein